MSSNFQQKVQQKWENRRRKHRAQSASDANSRESLEGKAKKRIQQYIMFTEETYKTELCRSFQATRTCPYGLECRFAHGINELAPRIFEKNVFKTEPCLHFKKEGRCKFGTRCRYLHDEVRIQLNEKVTVLYSETEAILRGITHNDDGTISVQSHAYYPVFNLLQLFGDNEGFVKRGSVKSETYSSIVNEANLSKKQSHFVGVRWKDECKKWYASVYANGKHHCCGLYEREGDAARAVNKKCCELKIPIKNKGLGPAVSKKAKSSARRSPVTAEEVSLMVNRLALPQNEPGQWAGSRPKACQTFVDFTEELENLNRRFEAFETRPRSSNSMPPRPEESSTTEKRFEEKPRASSLGLWGQNDRLSSERTPPSPQLNTAKKLSDSVSRRSPRPNPLSLPMSLSSKSQCLAGFGRESPPYEDFVSTPPGSSAPLNKSETSHSTRPFLKHSPESLHEARFPWIDDPYPSPSHETNGSSSFSSPSSGFPSPTLERQDSFPTTGAFSSPSNYRFERPGREYSMSSMSDPLHQPFRHFRGGPEF